MMFPPMSDDSQKAIPSLYGFSHYFRDLSCLIFSLMGPPYPNFKHSLDNELNALFLNSSSS
jgi:hypothetical protein